jgi:toxin YoeB
VSFELIFTNIAHKGILRHKKAGNKKLIIKLDQLLSELEEHPETGTGKPERLKNNLSGLWSRRINKEHRLIYSIDGKEVTVTVVSAYGHYS